MMNAPFLSRVLRSYQQRLATYLYESDAAFALGAGKGAAALTASLISFATDIAGIVFV
jgi:hypothetical protein